MGPAFPPTGIFFGMGANPAAIDIDREKFLTGWTR